MKTAVVTGATGFIGKAFTAHLLENGYHVYAVGRDVSRLTELEGPALTCIKADFADYDTLHERILGADTFYHLAWDGAYGPKTADYALQMDNARHACDGLMQAMKIGCKKFVLAGTVAELEILEHIDNNVCHPRGTCIYAAAKLTAEMMCKTLAAQNGIGFNCGLFANIVGPGDRSKRSTNSILHQFLEGKAPKLVKGEGLNDWLYVKDAVRLIRAMGEAGVNMKTYYIGHTDLWPLRKIIERARDVVAPGLELAFGEIPDQFLTDYSYISTHALWEDTGIKAEYDFDTAIRETAAWVKTLDF